MNASFHVFPDGDVIAFLSGIPANPGMVMSYQHIGQHGEASAELAHELRAAMPEEYAELLRELNGIYDDEIEVCDAD